MLSVKVTKHGTIQYVRYSFLLVFYSIFVPKTHHFWDIRLVTIQLQTRVRSRSRSSESTRIDPAAYDFLLAFHSNHGPISHTVSEINGNFSCKSQNFPTPVYFVPPLKGFPWNLIPVLGVKKLEWLGYRAEKEVSAVRIQYTNVMDRRTDGQTPDDSKDRTYA